MKNPAFFSAFLGVISVKADNLPRLHILPHCDTSGVWSIPASNLHWVRQGKS